MQSHAIDMFKERFGRVGDRKLSRVKAEEKHKNHFLRKVIRVHYVNGATATADSIVHVDTCGYGDCLIDVEIDS